MDTAKPLTADQLNNMAKSSGYQGSAFTSVGLPSAPATGPGSLGYKPSEDPANSPGGIQSGSSVSNQSKPGFDVFGNPTAQTPTATTETSTTNQSSIDANKQVLQQAQADYQTASKTAMDTITNIQNGTTPLSAGEQAQVDGLKQQFQVFIDQHVLTNTGASGTANIRGYQQGAAEYDPTFQAKTIGSIVTAGQNKVADLNIKMASSVATLTQGFKDNNIKAIQNAWSMYQDASTKRTEALQKTIDSTQKAIKEANDAKIAADKVIYDKEEKEQKDMYDQVIKPIQEIMESMKKSGASDEALSKVGAILENGGTVNDAFLAAGDSLQTATGKPGEYLFVKNQYARSGLVAPTFDEWDKAEQKKELSKKYNEAYQSAKGSAQAKAEVDAAQESLLNNGLNVHTGPYAPALSVILGSSKFTAMEKKDLINSVKNGEDPGVVLRNRAKGIMEGATKTQLNNYEAIIESTRDLQTALTAYYATPGAKTGLFRGNFEKVANRFGEVKDPDLVDLLVQIQTQLQKYRNSISGTAYSDQEGKDIASIFPGIDKGEILNNTVAKARLKATESIVDGMYKTTLGDNAYSKLKEGDAKMQGSGIDEQKKQEASLVSGLDKIKITNPKIYQAASNMYTSNNPETKQPYSAADILSAFPELK